MSGVWYNPATWASETKKAAITVVLAVAQLAATVLSENNANSQSVKNFASNEVPKPLPKS